MWYKRLFFTDIAKSWLAANFTSRKRGYHQLKLLWKSKHWVKLKVQLTKNGLEKCGINALASIAILKGTLAHTGYHSVVPYYMNINFRSQNYPGKL